MKKLTIALLVFAMTLALCACGQDQLASDEMDRPASDALVDQMPEFETIDLQGNQVDNDIFSQADITVINFWGTFCGPCINEMPELAEWEGQLPDNVQIIGVVVDAAGPDTQEYEAAKTLVKDNGISYTNIIAGEDFPADVLNRLQGVPTTVFVDAEGKSIADEILGADVEAYKRTVEELL